METISLKNHFFVANMMKKFRKGSIAWIESIWANIGIVIDNDHDSFCPEKCDEVFENLKDLYFLGPNESGYQQVLWKVYFKGGNAFPNLE